MKIRPSTQLHQDGASDGQALVWNAAQGMWLPAAGGSLTVQDENANVATGVTQIDFQGAGVTASAGTGEVVVTIPGGLTDPTTVKGDLISRTSTAITRVGVGPDGTVLVADATAAAGVSWQNATSNAHRERYVAGGGENTITLGTTPMTDSVLVWKNHTLLEPAGVDYTISGTTITLVSNLSAGDVISLYYLYRGAAPTGGGLNSQGPNSFAGLQIWLKSDAITGVGNNTGLSSWLDSSGSGNAAGQGTAASQPLYISNMLDSKPAVRFDGSNDSLVLASTTAVDLTGDFSVFIVCRFGAVNKGSTLQNTLLSKDYTRYEFFEYQTIQAAYVGGTANNINSASGVLAANTPYLLEWHRSAGAVTVMNNASQVASGTNSASASGTYPLTFGNRANGTGAEYYNGDLYEVFIYNQFRSSADQTSLRNYIKSRWPSIGLP